MKMIGKGKQWWVRGSYTVECAFIVPIVLGIIFALLYVLFYEHDKLVAQGNIRSGVLEYVTSGEDLPELSQWKKQVQSQLWMGKVTEANIYHSGLVIKGTAKIELRWKVPVMHYFLEEKQEMNCEMKWDVWNPTQVIRWNGGTCNGRV